MFNKLLRRQKEKLEEQINLIEKSIKEREQHLANINSQVEQSNQALSKVQDNLFESKRRLVDIQQEIDFSSGVVTMQELGLGYKPANHTLDEISFKKSNIQAEIAKLLGAGNNIIITREYRVDGSESKGNKFQKAFCENLMIGFTTYYNSKKKSITQTNAKKTEELVRKKFKSINKKGELLGVSIAQYYLELCIKLMYLELDEKIAKTEEREKIKEERRKLKEQEKLLAEAEKERKRLEDERKNLQKLFAKAVSEQEQADIKNKLAEVDKRTEEIDWRISHQSAGWLYIATTPCLEGMYKAGCTKQLNPLNRLAQLSSASVPYPFECHGLVFSENVFDLEAKLHKRLDSVRVNKMNRGKEFFYGSPEEAIKILKEEFKVDVHFVDENWIEEE